MSENNNLHRIAKSMAKIYNLTVVLLFLLLLPSCRNVEHQSKANTNKRHKIVENHSIP